MNTNICKIFIKLSDKYLRKSSKLLTYSTDILKNVAIAAPKTDKLFLKKQIGKIINTHKTLTKPTCK